MSVIENGNGNENHVDFGILFDLDGVIARGSVPLESAVKGICKLMDATGHVNVPIAFVTNGCNRDCDKAKQISEWLQIPVDTSQMIHAQSPLAVFRSYHRKRTLVIGQGKLKEMASDLGFNNICTIDDIKVSFPQLDMVDHNNRRILAENGFTVKEAFQKIEVIVIFGEPNRWETNLQLLVDILLTDGCPRIAPSGIKPNTIPILACNMDLVFMAEACMPRFGNGSFLICLESLYKKITGFDLQYTALVGKPSEITFRYAEHCIAEQATKLGIRNDIRKLYFVGDNPQVDIYGVNLYNRYIRGADETNKNLSPVHPGEPARRTRSRHTSSSRRIPEDFQFREQTVRFCEGILVETGVYNPNVDNLEENERDHVYHHGHRDFALEPKLKVPAKYAKDCNEAIDYIIEQEDYK